MHVAHEECSKGFRIILSDTRAGEPRWEAQAAESDALENFEGGEKVTAREYQCPENTQLSDYATETNPTNISCVRSEVLQRDVSNDEQGGRKLSTTAIKLKKVVHGVTFLRRSQHSLSGDSTISSSVRFPLNHCFRCSLFFWL